MTFLIDLDETIGRKVRVDLGRDQMGMSQKLLNASQIGARVDQVGGKAVTKLVRGELRIQSSGRQILLQASLDLSLIHI